MLVTFVLPVFSYIVSDIRQCHELWQILRNIRLLDDDRSESSSLSPSLEWWGCCDAEVQPYVKKGHVPPFGRKFKVAVTLKKWPLIFIFSRLQRTDQDARGAKHPCGFLMVCCKVGKIQSAIKLPNSCFWAREKETLFFPHQVIKVQGTGESISGIS